MGTEVGASEGESKPDRAGLEGMDRVLLGVRDLLFPASNLAFLLDFNGCAEPFFWTAGGRVEVSFTYTVLEGTNQQRSVNGFVDSRVIFLSGTLRGQGVFQGGKSSICTCDF